MYYPVSCDVSSQEHEVKPQSGCQISDYGLMSFQFKRLYPMTILCNVALMVFCSAAAVARISNLSVRLTGMNVAISFRRNVNFLSILSSVLMGPPKFTVI